MSKKQWYGVGVWFLVIGCIMVFVTIPELGAPPKAIAECDIFYVLDRLVYRLLGTLCIVASFACWLCGGLEKEEAK